MKTKLIASLAGAFVLAAFAYGCQQSSNSGTPSTGGTATAQSSQGLKQIMTERKLSEADVEAALLTYKPSGQKDEYLIFASGGQSGQILVIGVPSMRILKLIAVFTPEPWQGYGYGGYGDKVLEGGQQYKVGEQLTWADVHHPNLSEEKGDYDGQFLFVNDKANARVAVVDLRDFATKQLVPNKLVASDHGGAFVTPNTEYVVETSQYPAPLGRDYEPLSEYKNKYRGLAMFWKFDKTKGRIIESESFGVELPPYTQDLADSGKLTSDGYVFINSFNTEMATGGILEGNPPVESGASQNDTDFLHVINWRKAEALVKAGKAKEIKGVKVLMMDVTGPEKVLTLIPEPKSPHGADVTPDGEDIVVGGKLDTHGTVYNFKKIQTLIEAGTYEGKDTYGIAHSRVQGLHPRPGRAGPGPAAHRLRRQGLRLHLAVHRVGGRQVGPQDPEDRGQAARALQHRPHPRGRGRHRQPRRQVRGGDEQDEHRPLRPRTPRSSQEN